MEDKKILLDNIDKIHAKFGINYMCREVPMTRIETIEMAARRSSATE